MAEVVSFSAGAPGSGVFPSSLGSRPISTSKSGASFCEVVQHNSDLSSSSLLVQEAPLFVIPMGQDAEEEEEYYKFVSLVCHFNGFWPKLIDLKCWITTTYIPIMQQQSFIHPCVKGFFIVEFDIEEDRDLILSSGSWFWGNLGLFMKPWSPSFNPAFDTLSLAPVLVRLPNLPLHLWGLPSLEAIGSALGKFHFEIHENSRLSTSTFACICMEMDFSKGFPSDVILTGKTYSWSQNQTMREFPCVADLVLKWDILHPIVPKGPRRTESLENPLGGWDQTTTIKLSRSLLNPSKRCLIQIFLLYQLHLKI
jgi:hypothetical protein